MQKYKRISGLKDINYLNINHNSNRNVTSIEFGQIKIKIWGEDEAKSKGWFKQRCKNFDVKGNGS